VARALRVPPEACLFFDDEAACVAGAEAVGMRAFRVDRQLDHDDYGNRIIHNLTAVLDIASG
jgi:FMN phosphatase YigB (HAD superfamily)